MSAPAPALAKTDRIVSMDQFRGYTVAGMFLVNFVGGMAAIHAVLKHNNNYYSYADSIMPSFIFAVGFSYRLTILRRLQQLGAFKTYLSYVKRSLALILVSLMLAGFGGGFGNWKDFDEVHENYGGPKIEKKADLSGKQDKSKSGDAQAKKAQQEQAKDTKSDSDKKQGRRGRRSADAGEKDKEPWWTVKIPEHFGLNWRIFALKVLKANLWEVLSIIAVCQIFIMPVIAAPAWVRVLALIGCAVGHGAMTHSFNWEFENGLDTLYRVVQEGADTKYVHGLKDLAEALKTDALPPPKVVDLVRDVTTSVKLPDGRIVEVIQPRNFMDQAWGLRGVRPWDGGFFGIVSWSVAMLAGTLVYDLMALGLTSGRKAAILFCVGGVLMLLGYGMSCASRLYDLEQVPGLPEITKVEAERDKKVAEIEKNRDVAIKQIPEGKPVEAKKPAAANQAVEDKRTDEEKKADDQKTAEAAKKAEDERTKAEDARIKAVADAAIAAAKKEYEPQIAKIKEENKAGAERALRINEGYYDSETGTYVKGLYDRRDGKYAASPVILPLERAEGRDWKDLLAEPPFVPPPSSNPDDLKKGEPVRVWNYWMMGKRTVNQSFMTFAIGFAVFLYGLFVILCDMAPVRVGVFRTFGMNPLAAYAIHEITMHSIQPLIPENSPVWFCTVGFVFFFAITYLLVRGLEKQNIYIRM